MPAATICPTNAPRGTIDPLQLEDAPGADCTTTAVPLGNSVRGRKLIERQGNVAIYEGPHPGTYEVVVIRVVDASEIGDASLPRREQYPSANFWGTFGFTYSPASHPDDPLAAAKEKMKKLIRSAKTGNATERLLLHPPKKHPTAECGSPGGSPCQIWRGSATGRAKLPLSRSSFPAKETSSTSNVS